MRDPNYQVENLPTHVLQTGKPMQLLNGSQTLVTLVDVYFDELEDVFVGRDQERPGDVWEVVQWSDDWSYATGFRRAEK